MKCLENHIKVVNLKSSFKLIHLLFLTCFLSGCIAKGRIDVTMMGNSKNKQMGVLNLNIAQVKVENDQLIVDGANTDCYIT